jgi:arabinofuranosyltransferase
MKINQRFNIVILIMIPVLIAAIWYIWGGIETWDDAFISFRYAQNLAWGRGLVWNPGGEPTQGYTNFLFVILVAVGIKVGLFPVLSAYILNTLGLIAITLSFYRLNQYLQPERAAFQWLPPLAVAVFPLSLLNLTTGMETVFWGGLVFTTATCVLLYIKKQKPVYLAGVVIGAFCACLTRPEAVIFAGLWFLILLVQSPKRSAVIGAIFAFAVMGSIYAAWLELYFGDILPNPFYVKVDAPGLFPGQDYVLGFMRYFVTQILFLPAFIGLIRVMNRPLMNIIPYAVVISLLGFYLFTTPLIGSHFRFLYPVTCLFVFLIALGGVHIVYWLGEWMKRRSSPPVSRIFGQLLFGLICLHVFFLPTLGVTANRLKTGLSFEQPMHDLPQIALALASVPGIENAVIAYGDAGMVSYYTDSQFLDVVGLNHNEIARKAPQEGPDWVVNTVLAQQPDLISFYSNYDHTIFNLGHGIIGTAYSDLYQHPAFQENYVYAAGFDYIGFYDHWFVRKDSAFYQDVLDALHGIADLTEYTFIP